MWTILRMVGTPALCYGVGAWSHAEGATVGEAWIVGAIVFLSLGMEAHANRLRDVVVAAAKP